MFVFVMAVFVMHIQDLDTKFAHWVSWTSL